MNVQLATILRGKRRGAGGTCTTLRGYFPIPLLPGDCPVTPSGGLARAVLPAGSRRHITIDERVVGTPIAVDRPRRRVGVLAQAGRPEHPPDVLLRLRVRWDAAVGVHDAFTGVVGRERQRHAALVTVEQVAEMAHASADVLAR